MFKLVRLQSQDDPIFIFDLKDFHLVEEFHYFDLNLKNMVEEFVCLNQLLM